MDIPAQMFKIAAGERLPFEQADIVQTGWAIEGRVYAEDPYRGFLPSSGTITGYCEPPATNLDTTPQSLDRLGFDSRGLRIDAGVVDGSVVEPHYDPMLSKVIVRAESRTAAIERLRALLNEYVVPGVQTNIPFLQAVLDRDRFKDGDTTTHFIEEEFPTGFSAVSAQPTQDIVRVAHVVASVYCQLQSAQAPVPRSSARLQVHDASGKELLRAEVNSTTSQPQHEGSELTYRVDTPSDHETRVCILEPMSVEPLTGGEIVAIRPISCDTASAPAQEHHAEPVDPANAVVHVLKIPHGGHGLWPTLYNGVKYFVQIGSPGDLTLAEAIGSSGTELAEVAQSKQASDGTVRAPMAGNVVDIRVNAGDRVVSGQTLLTLEAMKMQNVLTAPVSGTVHETHCRPGDHVGIDQALLHIRTEAETETTR